MKVKWDTAVTLCAVGLAMLVIFLWPDIVSCLGVP